MAKENKPTREKDPRKVLAGQKGGLARANNQRKASQSSERPPKRKNAAPLADSSDLTTDELDELPRRKRTMLEGTPTEETAPRVPSLRRLLDPNTTVNTDTASPSNADPTFPSEVKEEKFEDDNDPLSNNSAKSKAPSTDAVPIAISSTETSDPPHPSPLALPEILIKELFKGHKCQCIDCEPDIMQRMYDEARRDVIQSQGGGGNYSTRDQGQAATRDTTRSPAKAGRGNAYGGVEPGAGGSNKRNATSSQEASPTRSHF